MKHWRIILVVLALCVGAGVYLFVRESPEPSEQPAVMRYDAASVNRVELRAEPSAKPVVLRRVKGEWRLTSPVQARANQGRADALADKVSWLETRGELAEPKDPGQYGLGDYSSTVSFTPGKNKQVVIRLGNRTKDGTAAYAAVEGINKVFLVDPSLIDDVHKGVSALRDVNMVELNRGDVYKITVARGPERITLEKKGGDWGLTYPVRARADADGLDMVLINSLLLRSNAFVDENPTDLARYGLEQPRLIVTLYAKGRRKPVSLYFGAGLPEGPGLGQVFARTSTDTPVFLVSQHTFDSVNRKLSDLRSKRIFKFPTDEAYRVSLEQGGRTLELRKQASADSWEITAPVKMAADPGEVGDLLFYLSRLKAESFISLPGAMSNYGLDKPTQQAIVWTSGTSQPRRVSLGKRVDGAIYAVTTGEPGVAEVDAFTAGRIKPDVSVYREKSLVQYDPKKVQGVSLIKGDQRISIVRGDTGWQIVYPVHVTADPATVDSIVFAFHELEGDKLVAENPQDLAQYGLDKPRLELQVTFSGNETPVSVKVGKESPEGMVYLMVGSRRGVFAKQKWILQFLEKDMSELRRAQ